MKQINARGLACPAPVLLTKETVEKEAPTVLTVTVDNEAASQNVSRFLESQHFQTEVETDGKDFHVTGKRDAEAASAAEKAPVPEKEAREKKIMVMVATDRIGFGDDELGLKLMISFIKTLAEMGNDLWRLVLVNNGVKLTIEGSEVLPTLQEYAEKGLHILVCGTCLDHFKLLERKRVGETTNMLDIVTAMQLADKVINL